MEKEMVNHPSHYLKKGRIECIELLDGLTRGSMHSILPFFK